MMWIIIALSVGVVIIGILSGRRGIERLRISGIILNEVTKVYYSRGMKGVDINEICLTGALIMVRVDSFPAITESVEEMMLMIECPYYPYIANFSPSLTLQAGMRKHRRTLLKALLAHIDVRELGNPTSLNYRYQLTTRMYITMIKYDMVKDLWIKRAR